jgi:SSS family solute:Na+ symporter
MRTVPDVIESKYGATARLIATLIILIAYLGITAYQYKGVGFVLNSTLGISTSIGTLISFAVIVATAVVGGLYSVAYTDFMSAVLILIGLCVGVPLAWEVLEVGVK